VESESEAEQHEDVHDEEAGDVAQDDVLEHDGEGVHRLEALGELQREHPADDEHDRHHLDVDGRCRSAAVQRVPDDRRRCERQRQQLSQISDRGRQKSKYGAEQVAVTMRIFFALQLEKQPYVSLLVIFAVDGAASCLLAPVTVRE